MAGPSKSRDKFSYPSSTCSQESVSPNNKDCRDLGELILANEHDSDGDDEGIGGEPSRGDPVERVKKEEDKSLVKKMLDPRLPTQEEVEEHYRFHIPYRNWCPVCVRAKGRDMDHNLSDRDRKVSEYCFDYCFPGDEFGYKLTVLVGKERLTKNWMATSDQVEDLQWISVWILSGRLGMQKGGSL